jgi:hypothetical protein
VIEGKPFTVADLLAVSRRDVRTTQELSWTVSAYARCLSSGETWRNRFGEPMSLAALAKALIAGDESGCGGTHRLSALAQALLRAERAKEPDLAELRPTLRRLFDGELATLRQHQQPSGFFEVPMKLVAQRAAPPFAVDIQFTGHSLEWMTMACEAEELRADWVVMAVEGLTQRLEPAYELCQRALQTREIATEGQVASQFYVGSVCHAIGGLNRWLYRVGALPVETVPEP